MDVASSAACHSRSPRLTVRGPLADGVPQLESTLEMTERGTRCERLGSVGRGEQSEERPFRVARTVEVEGQLTRPVGAAQGIGGLLLQRLGDAAVQARSLRREQVGVDDLSEQRVAEPVGVAGVVHHEQLCVDHGPHRGFELGRRAVR